MEDAEAAAAVEAVAAAGSPEEAARVGRRVERARPDLLRPDWPAAKLAVMAAALRAKVCRTHPALLPVFSGRCTSCQRTLAVQPMSLFVTRCVHPARSEPHDTPARKRVS